MTGLRKSRQAFGRAKGNLPMMRCAAALLALLLVGACTERKAPPPAAGPVKGDVELLLEKAQKDPKDAESWFHIADLYERALQYPQEVDALQKVIAARPDMGFAHYKLGNTYNRLGKREEAIAAFLEAKKTLPKNPALYNNLGWTFGQVGRTKEQIEALRQAIALRPRYATARLSLGIVLLKQGDRAGAEAQLAALAAFDEGAAADLKKEIDARNK